MIAQAAIFQPFAAAAALTFVVPVRRLISVARREITPADFRLGESDRVPAHVALANRNYMNLLELPTLFYPICLAFFVTGRVTTLVLALAWAYVVLRAIHSLIHLTRNDVIHRLTAFALRNAVLIALWIVFFV